MYILTILPKIVAAMNKNIVCGWTGWPGGLTHGRREFQLPLVYNDYKYCNTSFPNYIWLFNNIASIHFAYIQYTVFALFHALYLFDCIRDHIHAECLVQTWLDFSTMVSLLLICAHTDSIAITWEPLWYTSATIRTLQEWTFGFGPSTLMKSKHERRFTDS